MTKSIIQSLNSFAQNRSVQISLLVISILFIVTTSLYVGLKGAEIHSYNHDQLVDSYMFDSVDEFKQSVFPAPHTFFIKWPIFALSGLLGNSQTVFTVATTTIYLISVLAIVLLLWLITKKNYLIASLCIVIYGLVLLIIPMQSSPGVLAPVNMAMITTRNIEYLLYIIFILCLVKSKKIISPFGIFSVAIIAVLGLTDKLFLLIGMTAAILHIAYSLFLNAKNHSNVSITIIFRPLFYILTGYIFATLLALVISSLQITNIYQPLDAAPFNFVESVSQAMTALEWALHATLVNFGVNPFGEAIGLKIVPSVLNGIFLLLALYSIMHLYWKKPLVSIRHNNYSYLGYWLVISSVAAFVIYIASDHYLENDLRYMGIFTFAAIISLALYLSSRNLAVATPLNLLLVVLTLLSVTPIYVLTARANYARDLEATQQIYDQRFTKIAQSMQQYEVDVLLAEYWNTSPVRYKMNNSIETSPLIDTPCVKQNYHLTSKAWYVGEDNKRSAIVVTEGRSPESDVCLESLLDNLGSPEVSIALTHDKEKLLIYDYDIRKKIKW